MEFKRNARIQAPLSDGEVTVLTGVTSPGCGNETAMAQIAAEHLGCEFERVEVIQGDTDLCPYGLGNYSSRATMYGGSATQKASVSSSVTFDEVVNQIYRYPFRELAEDEEPGLEATRYFRMGNIYHQPEKQGRFSHADGLHHPDGGRDAHVRARSPGDPVAVHPLGMKGVGESGVGAALGALCSAIENAFPELELELDELVLTPRRVWRARWCGTAGSRPTR